MLNECDIEEPTTQSMIPKIFHQTYKSEILPENERMNAEIAQSAYPDHHHILWTDQAIREFLEREFPQFSTLVEQMTAIQKVDFARYCWMYSYGGVYSDLDVLFVKRIPVEDYSGVLFVEREWTFPVDRRITTSVHNVFMASKRAHPLWLDILDQIALKHAAGERSVYNLTGPNSISDIITRLHLHVKYDDIDILPGSYIYQKGHSKHSGENSHLKHFCYGSWR